ncbi:hypothetical protein [Streptomyces sp. 184]|uniref:hypothetical protein n=1 Tax=Streptomyces sp. 184 TaxID=1827526 RepID=UPI003891CD47
MGISVPAALTTSMRDTHLRLELHDPGTDSVPNPAKPTPDNETGRGLVVAATAADWGVDLHDAWVDLPTGLDSPIAYAGGAAEALVVMYRQHPDRTLRADASLSVATLDDPGKPRITDILRWLDPRGCGPGPSS